MNGDEIPARHGHACDSDEDELQQVFTVGVHDISRELPVASVWPGDQLT